MKLDLKVCNAEYCLCFTIQCIVISSSWLPEAFNGYSCGMNLKINSQLNKFCSFPVSLYATCHLYYGRVCGLSIKVCHGCMPKETKAMLY